MFILTFFILELLKLILKEYHYFRFLKKDITIFMKINLNTYSNYQMCLICFNG